MTASRTILLVEDNEDDAFLMRRAMNKAGILNPILTTEDVQEHLVGTVLRSGLVGFGADPTDFGPHWDNGSGPHI